MDHKRKQELDEYKQELEAIRDTLHDLSVRESRLGHELDPIEKEADALGVHNVGIAVRNAYIRLVDAGRILTQMHLDLNIPATVFSAEEPAPEQEAA